MTTHQLLNVFRPSSASRQLTCTASIKYDVEAPYKTSTQANLGNKLHGIAEEILNGDIEDVEDLILLEDNDIDKNAIRMLKQYDDYIACLEDETNNIMVEKRANLSYLYDFGTGVNKYGTADCAVINDDTNILHIVDLKTGRNDVFAKDNIQLLIYAYCLYMELKDFHDFKYVEVHIFQSLYLQNTNSSKLSIWDLENFIHRNVIQQLDKIKFLQLDYKLGSHCKYCPNIGNCKEMKREIDNLLLFIPHSDILPLFDKADMIKHEKIINDAMIAYKEDLEEALKSGEEVTGVKLVKGNKRKYIKDSDMQMLEYLVEDKGLSTDDLYNFKAKTPNQIINMLEEKEIMIDISEFITVQEPKINLALSSNPRKAIKI